MTTESDKEAMERSAQFVEEFLKENGTSFKDKIIYEKNVSYYEGLEEGRAEGLEEGRAKGLEEAYAESLEKGIAKGKKESAISIAKNLLSIPLTIEQIASSTGLSIEEVEALNKN